MNTLRAVAILLLSTTAGAADWRFSLGIHDYVVPQADSDTLGVDARASFDQHSERGLHYFASLDLFVDHDEDHLDPDHIPIWWQLHAGSDGTFLQSGKARLGWTANFDTSMNTVSSIERRMTALPALVGAYDGNVFEGALTAGAGWFFQEIDDDVPKTRGYGREDFRNSTGGYAVKADARIRIGESWSASAMALGWWASGDPLWKEYKAELRHQMDGWHEGSALAFSADYNDYNLDVYASPGLPPILPWDHDVLFRLTLVEAW
jgi:hypothetical protein